VGDAAKQKVFNSTNTTSGRSGDGGSLEEIKKRPVHWQGWLPLAYWSADVNGKQQRQEIRDSPESAESFFLDVVANHFCSQKTVFPKLDVRIQLLWYPISVENLFLSRRLALDRQRYQEGTNDQSTKNHPWYKKKCKKKKTWHKMQKMHLAQKKWANKLIYV
jgi:hypothetical protein